MADRLLAEPMGLPRGPADAQPGRRAAHRVRGEPAPHLGLVEAGGGPGGRRGRARTADRVDRRRPRRAGRGHQRVAGRERPGAGRGPGLPARADPRGARPHRGLARPAPADLDPGRGRAVHRLPIYPGRSPPDERTRPHGLLRAGRAGPPARSAVRPPGRRRSRPAACSAALRRPRSRCASTSTAAPPRSPVRPAPAAAERPYSRPPPGQSAGQPPPASSGRPFPPRTAVSASPSSAGAPAVGCCGRVAEGAGGARRRPGAARAVAALGRPADHGLHVGQPRRLHPAVGAGRARVPQLPGRGDRARGLRAALPATAPSSGASCGSARRRTWPARRTRRAPPSRRR